MTSTSLLLFVLPVLILGTAVYARGHGVILLKNPRQVEIVRVTTIVLLIIAAFLVGRVR